jgi:hypothetical protein
VDGTNGKGALDAHDRAIQGRSVGLRSTVQLVAVRYRYDERNWRRSTTVELVVDDSPWAPERHISDPDRLVGLRIGWAEKEHQVRLRAVQARWDPTARLWWVALHHVTQLGLEERIAAWDPPREGISSKV